MSASTGREDKDYEKDIAEIDQLQDKILSNVWQDDKVVHVGDIPLRKISEDIEILPAWVRLETFLYKMPHESFVQYDFRRSITIKLHEEHGMSPLVAISRGRAVINRIWYGVSYSDDIEKDIKMVLGEKYATLMKATEAK